MTVAIAIIFLVLPYTWYSLPRGTRLKGLFSTLYTIIYLLLVLVSLVVEDRGLVESGGPGLLIFLIFVSLLAIGHGGNVRDQIEKDTQKAQQKPNNQLSDHPPSEKRETLKKIDIYTANIENLSALPAISLIRAKKIRQYVDAGGSFSSFEEFAELLNLKDFGQGMLRDRIDVKSSATRIVKQHPSGRVIDV